MHPAVPRTGARAAHPARVPTWCQNTTRTSSPGQLFGTKFAPGAAAPGRELLAKAVGWARGRIGVGAAIVSREGRSKPPDQAEEAICFDSIPAPSGVSARWGRGCQGRKV